MHLYDCRFDTFIPHATSGEIADILSQRFVERLEQHPSDSEVGSWRNSLGAFAEALDGVGVDDAWIVLEYQLPLASTRIDCMLLGSDRAGRQNGMLVELKQWDRCEPTPVPEVVRVGGIEMLHPSAQVRNYRRYLEDAHAAFSDGGAYLSSCAYLHNLRWEDASGFFDAPYRELLEDSPIYTVSRVDELAAAALDGLGAGASPGLVDGVLRGGYKPSRKLLTYVADAIDGHEPWHLLDEQQVVFNRVMGDIAEARRLGEKRAIIVTGAPGTGKSVIAVQVVGAAARGGYGVVHATGSKAFTTNLRGIVGRRETFSYFNNFTKVKPNDVELIVCDEAHRIRETSSTRFRKGDGRLQVDELLSAGRVTAFFLDQRQSVRANEIGSVHLIEERARALGIPVSLHDLNTQFRCAGSESYIRWVDHMLGLSPNRSMAWKTGEEYDLRLVDDIYELEAMLRAKTLQGSTARMVAGFCWEWSDPRPDGTLVEDVVVGTWSKPWNRKPREMWRGRRGSAESPARHPYTIWATQDEGFEQVGCIYSAQGFEFDYVGLIWGGDLRWDGGSNRWVADMRQSKDVGFRMGLGREGAAVEKLKQIYRVLATRGMKGTYIYCLDRTTRDYIDRMGGGLL